MGELWAVTAYFNPMRYASRLANYREFRRRLSVPLLTIELGFEDRFDLVATEADILVRRRGRDVLWHKELLLNTAIRALPASCTKVAWLDCDIVFADPAWGERLKEVLDRHRLVQLFQRCHRLGPGEGLPTSDARRAECFSLVHLMENKSLPDEHFRLAGTSSQYAYTPGLAWAARRQEIETHGLYDSLILGSGDRALLSAACGRQDDFVLKLGMNSKQADHYLSWANPVQEWAKGDVASLPGEVYTFWHGHLDQKRYWDRYKELELHAFDPAADIARDPGGGWVWSSEKPDLHRFVKRYFEERREDAAANAPAP